MKTECQIYGWWTTKFSVRLCERKFCVLEYLSIESARYLRGREFIFTIYLKK